MSSHFEVDGNWKLEVEYVGKPQRRAAKGKAKAIEDEDIDEDVESIREEKTRLLRRRKTLDNMIAHLNARERALWWTMDLLVF